MTSTKQPCYTQSMNTIKGNLITLAKDGTFNLIVHGCNCHCTMGSGIAPAIAEAFNGPMGPRQADNLTVAGDRGKLGDYTVSAWLHPDTLHSVLIINAYTQYDIASEYGDIMVDYDAVRSCFKDITDSVKNFVHPDPIRIGYPMIGAGLAGGDWDVISAIINEELEGLNHTLVEWDGT